MKRQYIAIAVILSTMLAAGQAAVTHAADMTYLVGLGDSRAAGAGLPMKDLSEQSRYDTECQRSPYASIAYISESTNTPVVSFACSGATTDDLYESETINGTVVPSQISQIPTAILTDPGTVFRIETGANDIKWSTWLAKCARYTCGDQRRDTVAANALLLNFERRLYRAIYTLKARGATGKIMLVGTYNPLPSDAAAVEQYGITTDEYAWIVTYMNKFNTSIQRVATFTDATYVPASLSATDMQTLSDAIPYHPTISGQQTLSQQFINAL